MPVTGYFATVMPLYSAFSGALKSNAPLSVSLRTEVASTFTARVLTSLLIAWNTAFKPFASDAAR